MSKYFQEPLKYTGEVGESERMIKSLNMNKRIISNSLGTDEPIDLYDGMFFLKDNDPIENERTLYLNYKGTLQPFVHINADGTVDISGGGGGTGTVNLAGSNVVGYLPLSKLSTGTDTLDNTNNFIVVDKENKIKIIDKQELLDLISGGGSVDLSLYLKKDEASSTYATKTELSDGLATKQDAGEYITNEALTQGLATKQDKGDYATVEALNSGLAGKQDTGDYATNTALTDGLALKQDKGEYITNQQLTEGLETKQDKGDYITSEDLTADYFNKNTDKINLSTQTENKLSVENGGTGAITIEEARKNLETFLQPTITADVDLNDISWHKKKCYGYWCNSRINSPTNSIGHLINMFLNDNAGWQRYYSWSGLDVYGRVNTNNTYGEWKKLRNKDGSIPFDCGGVIKKYTNTAGMWTETLLDTGEILLQGYSINTTLTGGTITVALPKTVKYSAGCSPTYTTAQTQQLYTTFTTTNFTIKGASNAVITWHYTGILA